MKTSHLTHFESASYEDVVMHAELDGNIPPAVLPEGYRFDRAERFDQTEVFNLMRQVEAGKDIELKDMIYGGKDDDGSEMIAVGVRDAAGELVGFGDIVHGDGVGIFGDFVVSPNGHQSKGIGKAIILERMRRAKEAGLRKLEVSNILDTNTVTSFYQEVGFRVIPETELFMGGMKYLPNPGSRADLSAVSSFDIEH